MKNKQTQFPLQKDLGKRHCLKECNKKIFLSTEACFELSGRKCFSYVSSYLLNFLRTPITKRENFTTQFTSLFQIVQSGHNRLS